MAPSDIVRRALFKTELCRYYFAAGCAKSNCPFAHTEAELRPRPSLQKTTFCHAHRQGKCAQGKQCPFAHTPCEIRCSEGIYKTQLCVFHEGGFGGRGRNADTHTG